MAIKVFKGTLPDGMSISSFAIRERTVEDLAPARAMAAKMDPAAAKLGGASFEQATMIEVVRRCLIEVDGEKVNGADYMAMNKWSANTLAAVVDAFFEHLMPKDDAEGKATGTVMMM